MYTLPPMSDAPSSCPLEIEDIKAILPHRSPFLLVDRILELEADRRVVGLKNVTSNERYFIAGPGGVPTLPASILTEAMAQAGAVLILSKPENRSRLVYFMGIDRVRYRRPVVAGDQVLLEGEVLRLRSKMGSLRGRARVDGKVVCEGQMTFALGDRPGAAALSRPAARPLSLARALSKFGVCSRARGRALDRRRPRARSNGAVERAPRAASTRAATASSWTAGASATTPSAS